MYINNKEKRYRFNYAARTYKRRFVEEISDVLMYYTEVLRRLDITPKELSKAYVNKYENNLNRNYIEDNKKKYV